MSQPEEVKETRLKADEILKLETVSLSSNDDPHPVHTSPAQARSLLGRRLVFTLLCFMQIAACYDTGSTFLTQKSAQPPAKYGLSKAQAGLMGSLSFLGLTLSSLLAGPILTHLQPKWTVVASLVSGCLWAALFAAAPNILVLLVSRFFSGASAAFMVVFFPVWVDEFAPRENCTLWMSIIQGGVPVGITLGYVCSGYMTANRVEVSIPFYAQAGALILPAFLLLFVPPDYLDTRNHTEPSGSSLHVIEDQSTTTWHKIRRLYINPVYMLTVFALCALYFVVTGLQMWVTEYMTVYLGASKNLVVSAFAVTSSTAPILGVLCGGLMLDRLGGYRGRKGALVATRTSFILGMLCVVVAYWAILMPHFWANVVLIWLVLFFGAAIVPPCTGVLMSSVSKNMRSLASSVATMHYNLLGFFAGPTMAGILADALGGTQYGFFLVLGFSAVGAVILAAAWGVAGVAYRKEQKGVPDGVGQQAEGGKEPKGQEEEFDIKALAYESAVTNTTVYIIGAHHRGKSQNGDSAGHQQNPMPESANDQKLYA